MTAANLSAEQLAAYRTQGVVHLPGILPVGDVSALLSEIDCVVAYQLRCKGMRPAPFRDETTLLQNLQSLLATDATAYLAALRHAAKLVSITRLACTQAFTEITRELGFEAVTSPTSPVLHLQCDSLRVSDGYFGFAPHQDWPSIQGALDAIVMWVPLVDVGVDRFPVEFLPRSHLQGLLPGRVVVGALEIAEECLEGDWVRIATRPGDVVLFSVFTAHRTAVEGCSGLRIAVSTRFENSAEPTFAARGYPCAYRRTVERELITPDFPRREQVRGVFD